MRRRDDGDDDSLPDAVDGERCPRPQRYLLRPDFRTLFDKTSLPILFRRSVSVSYPYTSSPP